jgi:hypothetical protein
MANFKPSTQDSGRPGAPLFGQGFAAADHCPNKANRSTSNFKPSTRGRLAEAVRTQRGPVSNWGPGSSSALEDGRLFYVDEKEKEHIPYGRKPPAPSGSPPRSRRLSPRRTQLYRSDHHRSRGWYPAGPVDIMPENTRLHGNHEYRKTRVRYEMDRPRAMVLDSTDRASALGSALPSSSVSDGEADGSIMEYWNPKRSSVREDARKRFLRDQEEENFRRRKQELELIEESLWKREQELDYRERQFHYSTQRGRAPTARVSVTTQPSRGEVSGTRRVRWGGTYYYD